MNQLTIDVNTDLGTSSIGQKLLLKDGTIHQVSEEEYQMFSQCFPKVDVNDQLNQMVSWLYSNPSNRKTKRGIRRFINSWLSRAPMMNTPRFNRIESTRDRSLEDDLTDGSWANGS